MPETYFIHGLESFLIDWKVDKIVQELSVHAPEEVEILYLDGDELSPEALLENISFNSLFHLSRVVIIKRPPWLRKTKRKAAHQDQYGHILDQYLQEPEPNQTLIITAEEFYADNKVAKLLQQKAQVIKCQPLNAGQIKKILQEEMDRQNCPLSPGALELMAQSGQDLYYLHNLAAKLALLSGGREISRALAEEHLHKREEIKVFKLTEALQNKNLPQALAAYRQLSNQGENPVQSLFMIIRQFFLLGKIKAYVDKQYSLQEIAHLSGQKDYTVKNMIIKARNFTWLELQTIWQTFLDTDLRFKTTGQDPSLLLEILMVQICRR